MRAIALGLLLIGASSAAEMALVNASRHGETTRAIRLIRDGADVDFEDARGYTPLMWASASGDERLAVELIRKRARVNTAAHNGMTAWALAITNGSARVAEMLMSAGSNCQALDPTWDAAKAARTPIAKAIVRRAVRLGEQLLDASMKGNAPKLKWLIENGAPIGYTSLGRDDSSTALMNVARRGDALSVRVMLRALKSNPPLHVIHRALDEAPNEETRAAFGPYKRNLEPKQMPGAAQQLPTATQRRLKLIFARIRAAADAIGGPSQAPIAKASEWLSNRVDGDNNPSETYIQELERAAEILETLQDANVSEQARTARLNDVAEDLRLKTEHCRKTGIGMGGTIRVLVNTRRAGQAVNDWQVLYLPKIFQHAKGVTPGLIPGWSSPAREILEPGRYLVWARDPVSKKTTDAEIVPLSGANEITIDLAVP